MINEKVFPCLITHIGDSSHCVNLMTLINVLLLLFQHSDVRTLQHPLVDGKGE